MKLAHFMQALRAIVGKDAKQPTRKEYRRLTNKYGRKVTGKMHQVTSIRHFGTFRPLKGFNH